MVKVRNNSKGFGTVEVLLIVLALALLIGAGWYVYNRNRDENGSSSVPAKGSSSDNRQGEDIHLESMGVQLTQPTTMDTLLIGEGLNETQVKYAAFSTQKLVDLEANTYCDSLDGTSTPFHLGLLFRVDGTYPVEPTDENSYGVLIKQFDGYNLQFRAPSDNCFEDPQNQAQASAMSKELADVLKSSVREE